MRTVCRLVKLLHSHLYAGLLYLIQSRKKPMSRQLNEKLTSKYVYISNKKDDHRTAATWMAYKRGLASI